MARFIKVGARYINQEHITEVSLGMDDAVCIYFSDGTQEPAVVLNDQAEGLAFLHWLDGHVRDYGCDALAEYADQVAASAPLSAETQATVDAYKDQFKDIPF